MTRLHFIAALGVLLLAALLAMFASSPEANVLRDFALAFTGLIAADGIADAICKSGR